MKISNSKIIAAALISLLCLFLAQTLNAQEIASLGSQLAAAGETSDKVTFGDGSFGEPLAVADEVEEDEVCVMDVCIDEGDISAIAQSKAFAFLAPVFKWLIIIGFPIVLVARYVAKKVADTYVLFKLPVGVIAHWIANNVRITRKKK